MSAAASLRAVSESAAPGRLVPDARLEQRIPEPPLPDGLVVTVTHGGNTILSVGGSGALLPRLPHADHRALVAALLHALNLAHSTEPERSVVTEAAEALDGLTTALNPSDASEAAAALAGPILARCNDLVAAGKAQLQS